ncbi:GNAT family N-acetyltransferase [Caldalkalibacillus salinus]|uniref:GNAT family N-acetyltransferase n=1 Tax=Caldalkalibacillus salinus TaxID=2803787 RepID=UPI001920DB96|nr:GNAT family N-acetyltransferase [Caldalkalibacillus salinus]
MSWKLKTFSELSKQELYDIITARINVFVVEQDCPYPELDGKDQDSYHLFYIEEKGAIAAYSRILPPGVAYDEASIGRVIVNKKYRGKGLAKDMLRQALDMIHYKLDAKRVKIQAQQYLQHFYASFGFKSVSDMYLEDGIPHVDMLLTLDDEISADHDHIRS